MHYNEGTEEVYIRVPRSGNGSFMPWYEKRHGPWKQVLDDHCTRREVLEDANLREKYGDKRVLMLIRDPWEWLLSFYTMCYGKRQKMGVYTHPTCPTTGDLTTFLKALKVTPADWWVDEHGNLPENPHIIKLESLRSAPGFAPAVSEDKTEALTPRLRGMYESKFSREIELFNSR